MPVKIIINNRYDTVVSVDTKMSEKTICIIRIMSRFDDETCPTRSCTKIENVDIYEYGIINFWIEKVEWENGEIQKKVRIDKKVPAGGGVG